MAAATLPTQAPSTGNQAAVVRAVTVIMGTVVGLTFLFGFGNVLNLALRLGVSVWVAPFVAPAVDLSILGLLLGTRHLALHGANHCPATPRAATADLRQPRHPGTRRGRPTHRWRRRQGRVRRHRATSAHRLGRSRARLAPGHHRRQPRTIRADLP